jgi:hypothetical protein
MLHGNFGEEALKSAPLVGRPTALPLVVVDDQDATPKPSQAYRVVGEGILPLPRFSVIENLLGVRLAHINDREAVEVEIENLVRSQDARSASTIDRKSLLGRCPLRPLGRIKGVHD